MSSKKEVQQLYSKSDELFLQLSAYFKKLMHDNRKHNHVNIDQRKILKLFSFQNWDDFMNWVNEKLDQGGQNNQQSEKNILPEIIEEAADLQESISEEPVTDCNFQCEALAIDNAKLRKENILIQDKIETLQKELFKESHRFSV